LQTLALAERLSALRRLLARGSTIRQAEAKLRTPRSTLSRWAQKAKLPRRRRNVSRLSPEKQREVRRRIRLGESAYQIAREVPVSTRTAWKWREYFPRLREVIERSKTPLPCEKWRCPEGGELLKVTYCLEHKCHKPPGQGKRPRS
jgi:hypothetical protein